MLDINDNIPSFSEDQYMFVVPESADQLSGLNVSATDADIGTNAMIVYSILEGNEDATFVLGESFLPTNISIISCIVCI